jgi:hypothetical protein
MLSEEDARNAQADTSDKVIPTAAQGEKPDPSGPDYDAQGNHDHAKGYRPPIAKPPLMANRGQFQTLRALDLISLAVDH